MGHNRARRQQNKRGAYPLRRLTSVLAASAGAWILYSNTQIDHNVPLADAISARREIFASREGGRVSYYVERAGVGHPLVLLHSINAAASAYEMSTLFECYRGQRPVYALDWNGYGFSERADRVYTPRLFADTLREFLSQQVDGPADVVALSLASEFAARVAAETPQLIHSLVLISPSGLSRVKPGGGMLRRAFPTTAGRGDALHAVFAFPAWGRPLYDLLTTRASIRYFLRKSFAGAVPEAFVEYDYATSHQPGAEHVPLYFISGALFSKTIAQDVYAGLTIPTLVLYDRDGYTRFDVLSDVLAANRNWRAERIVPTLGLPQFEQLPQTVHAMEAFWSQKG